MSPRDWLHRRMTGKGRLVPPGVGHTNCGQQRAFPEVQRAPWVRVLSVGSGGGCPPPQASPAHLFHGPVAGGQQGRPMMPNVASEVWPQSDGHSSAPEGRGVQTL